VYTADAKPKKAPNRLICEKGPYLLQHAENPENGIPGVKRLSRQLRRRINQSSFPLAMPHAIGAM